MLSKGSITTIANGLNRAYCMDLDAKLMNALRAALENRHISVKRQNEIVNTFCNTLLGGK